MVSSRTLAYAKENMLRRQIREQFMLNDELIALFTESNREFFVPSAYQPLAFAEMQIPIGHQQVMMTPNEEARMLASLAITPEDTILEIGTGTGYMTTLLGRLGKSVESLDIFPEFVANANHKISQLGLKNITLNAADACHYTFPKKYDVISISTSTPLIPKIFLEHLQLRGRLFIIVGEAPAMTAVLVTRVAEDRWDTESLFETVLPEMIHAPKPNPFQF